MSVFRLPRCRRTSFFVFVLLMAMCSSAAAQTRVRVTREQATIWNRGFSIAVAIVRAGTELEVVGRQGNWYEVALPAGGGAGATTGFIAVAQVEVIAGVAPPARAPSSSAAAAPAATRARASEGVGIRGFGSVGGEFFDAHQSFRAIFGQPLGLFVGGGGEVRINQLFVQGMVQRFRRTGDRVFVFDGNTFKVGISDTITITPLTFTIGWRFERPGIIPYIGAGAGRYHYTETSAGADPLDDVDDHFTSYHVVVGGEWPTRSWWAPAIEVQYTHVPGALNGGVATSFDEHNLGGLEVRVKLAVGK